jgi:hypothetical protein
LEQAMKTGLLIVVLLGILAVTGWWAWDSIRSIGMDMPAHGWIALGLGVVFSLAVGVGLMALVFFSNRRGYDDHFGPEA